MFWSLYYCSYLLEGFYFGCTTCSVLGACDSVRYAPHDAYMTNKVMAGLLVQIKRTAVWPSVAAYPQPSGTGQAQDVTVNQST
jgi:hypothetical protein